MSLMELRITSLVRIEGREHVVVLRCNHASDAHLPGSIGSNAASGRALNLRLLIDAEHGGVRGRIQWQPRCRGSFRSSGSFDNLKVSVRCGCKPKVCQIRLMAM